MKTESTSSGFLKWAIWICTATFYFYEYVLRVSPSVMVPDLMQAFGITASSIGILSAFYLYAYAPMQLPVGLLMDRYGIRKILSIASIVCGLGALFFAMAHKLALAHIGRALIGTGSAFAFVAMIYVSSHWFPPKKRAFLIGIANSLAMFGASAGAGGPLAYVIRNIGWRETIFIFGLFGIALGVLVYIIFKSDKRDAAIERETSNVKPHILANLKLVASQKSTWINGTAALFFYMTTTAFGGLWGLSFIQTAYGVTREVAGYAISMVFMGWLVGGPLTGLLSDFLGKRTTAIRIGIIGTLVCLIPIIYFTAIPIFGVYILLFFVGLFSSAELLNFSLAIEMNSIQAKATAAAFTNFLISCGDAVVQPLVGFLLDTNWKGALENGIRVYAAHDYQIALSCLPVTLVLALVMLSFVKEKQAV